MGRRDRKYHKTLHQQAYDKLTGMLALGSSKHADMKVGDTSKKIYSVKTYQTYKTQVKYFIRWIRQKYPEITTLKKARKHVTEYLQELTDKTNDDGSLRYSTWSLHTAAAALNKLFEIAPDDPKRFQLPQRIRTDIRRSRIRTEKDRHFSVTNNDELIRFCKGTGCRRNVLEKLTRDDLWSRQQMISRLSGLQKKTALSAEEKRQMEAIRDALTIFPDQDYMLAHRRDKGGKTRFAPIVGPDRDMIIQRIQNTAPGKKVWEYVHSAADIHSYRNDYSVLLYKKYARDIDTIPYDRRKGDTCIRYQSEVYYCRLDEKGKRLDKRAMEKVTKALGHNRLSVIAGHYMRGI